MKCEWNDRCELCPKNGQFVHPWGIRGASIAAVTDQPDMDHKDNGSECVFKMDTDDLPNTAFVLKSVFAELELRLDHVYWTSAYKCASRITSDCKRSCEAMLEAEIGDFAVIAALGNNAGNSVSTLTTDAEIKQVWNPAYILRRPEEFDEYVEQWRDVVQSGHRTLDQFK